MNLHKRITPPEVVQWFEWARAQGDDYYSDRIDTIEIRQGRYGPELRWPDGTWFKFAQWADSFYGFRTWQRQRYGHQPSDDGSHE